MKSFSAMIFLCFLISFSPSGSQSHSVQRRETPLYVFPVDASLSGLDEPTAKVLIAVFEEEFQQDFLGKAWQFDFQWQQPYLGAGTSYYEGVRRIMIWGGMIRAEFMNAGALSAMLCHEMGHFLAGPPLQIMPSIQGNGEPSAAWASAEGTSDHYAATVCLPRLYRALQAAHPQLLKTSATEEFVVERCRLHPSPQSCAWVTQSGIDLVEFLQVYFDRDIAFADPKEKSTDQPVQTIQLEYPSYQCRMQIFVDGGTCSHGKDCAKNRCWYVPEKSLL